MESLATRFQGAALHELSTQVEAITSSYSSQNNTQRRWGQN